MAAIGPIDPSTLGKAFEAVGSPETRLTEKNFGKIGTAGSAAHEGELPFESILRQTVANANQASQVSDQAAQSFANGVNDDIHNTMIAVKKADIELRLVANVRNKLVDAFNDLWRMPV